MQAAVFTSAVASTETEPAAGWPEIVTGKRSGPALLSSSNARYDGFGIPALLSRPHCGYAHGCEPMPPSSNTSCRATRLGISLAVAVCKSVRKRTVNVHQLSISILSASIPTVLMMKAAAYDRPLSSASSWGPPCPCHQTPQRTVLRRGKQMSASWGKSVEPHVVVLCHVERGGRVLGCRQRAPHAVPCLKDRCGEAVRVALVVAGDARAVGWICRRAAPFSPAALRKLADSRRLARSGPGAHRRGC